MVVALIMRRMNRTIRRAKHIAIFFRMPPPKYPVCRKHPLFLVRLCLLPGMVVSVISTLNKPFVGFTSTLVKNHWLKSPARASICFLRAAWPFPVGGGEKAVAPQFLRQKGYEYPVGLKQEHPE